jgi:hypothetical protein
LPRPICGASWPRPVVVGEINRIGKIISLAVDFALRVGNNAVMDFFAHSGALPEQKLKSQ